MVKAFFVLPLLLWIAVAVGAEFAELPAPVLMNIFSRAKSKHGFLVNKASAHVYRSNPDLQDLSACHSSDFIKRLAIYRFKNGQNEAAIKLLSNQDHVCQCMRASVLYQVCRLSLIDAMRSLFNSFNGWKASSLEYCFQQIPQSSWQFKLALIQEVSLADPVMGARWFTDQLDRDKETPRETLLDVFASLPLKCREVTIELLVQENPEESLIAELIESMQIV
ncbi:hypothetical protein MIR68_010774 [Amoeboaphelidium protococcarum]|nr:hypothetical protein MIR68_010774 [Amoeboaphelidium protococcarum]